MEDDTIKILHQSWSVHFVAALLLGILSLLLMGERGRTLSLHHVVEWSLSDHNGLMEFQNIAQRFPNQCSYAKRPSTEEYHAIIDNGSDKLIKMPRIVKARNINPAVLKKIVEFNFELWGALSPERLTILPLYPFSVRLCQLRR